MDSYLQPGFYAKRTSCNVRYTMGFFRTDVNADDIKLDNFEKETIYCKNDIDYINRFIEHIKDKVIKKCKNLSSVKIMVATFDKDNMIHKIIFLVTNMLTSLLKIKEKINIYRLIFVVIEYEGKIVFTGSVNFAGL